MDERISIGAQRVVQGARAHEKQEILSGRNGARVRMEPSPNGRHFPGILMVTGSVAKINELPDLMV